MNLQRWNWTVLVKPKVCLCRNSWAALTVQAMVCSQLLLFCHVECAPELCQRLHYSNSLFAFWCSPKIYSGFTGLTYVYLMRQCAHVVNIYFQNMLSVKFSGVNELQDRLRLHTLNFQCLYSLSVLLLHTDTQTLKDVVELFHSSVYLRTLYPFQGLCLFFCTEQCC